MSSPKSKRAKRHERKRRRTDAGAEPTVQTTGLSESPPSIEPATPELEAAASASTATPLVETVVALPRVEDAPTTVTLAATDALEERVSDVPATKKEGSGRHRTAAAADSSSDDDAAKLDTASLQPVTRDSGGAPEMDFDDEEADSGFFAKSLEEVHHEEAVREAPELHDPELAPAPVYRRKGVDRRARSIVMGVLGVCALIGATAMLRRATSAPPSQMHTTAAMVDNAAPPPPAVTQAAPPPPVVEAQPAIAAVATVVPAATNEPAPAAPIAETTAAATAEPAPTVAAQAVATEAAPAVATAAPTTPTTTTATADTAAATTASAAPSEDPDAALSGPQLLAAARKAINSNPSKAATLARKAASKGAGGSAYYVLGAAYQMMGSNGAAKSAYANCAKSGAPEAPECAALVENM